MCFTNRFYVCTCDKYNSKAMNQRATHFALGSTSQNYNSIYAQDYTRKEAVHTQTNGNNPFRSNSLNLPQKGSFDTTNRTLLKAWEHADKAALDDKKLKELKTHHFKLGSYNPNQVRTTNKVFHDVKLLSGQASKNQQQSKNRMRAHNHDFKEQPVTNYQSSYANQYTSKEGTTYAKVTPAAQNAISFGNHQIPMVTTSAATYLPKHHQVATAKKQDGLGVFLGNNSEPMQTINQQYYDQKQIKQNQLPDSLMKQLRGTHFSLGGMPQNYNTQSGYYKDPSSQSKNNNYDFKIPTYQSGTWVDKQAKFNAATTNQRELPQRQTKAFAKAVQDTKAGIDLGGHQSNYLTQFKQQFVGREGTANQLDINKKSSVVIGGERGYWTTEQKGSYRTNDLNEARINVDIKKQSKEDHFRIGGTGNQVQVSVYQDQYRKDVDKRNHLFHKTKN